MGGSNAWPSRSATEPHWLSSIGNSRESTSIIISMPPGNTLFVVISRSLCECHMNAQPRSFGGFACVFDGFRSVQFALVVLAHAECDPRSVASGPKYGEPPYH